jgi:hypothetical protein
MHPQLLLLLELQDLNAHYRELSAGTEMDAVESGHFNIDVSAASAELAEKIAQLEEALEPRIRSRYGRVKASLDRVVVPVINGVCYGCFVSIPTATAGEQDPNADLQGCQHCGRFIYIVP